MSKGNPALLVHLLLAQNVTPAMLLLCSLDLPLNP